MSIVILVLMYVRTWFTVQNHTLRRSDSDFFVEFWMSQRELNGFFYLLDLLFVVKEAC